MAKKSLDRDYSIYNEVDDHYVMWIEDNDQRMYRENGWNDITDAYWGKLPDNWPYNSRVIDPRIRTSLIEKNGRLLNSKLRGRVKGRDSVSDPLKAKIQNALLDFQWDNAKDGGSMLEKWGEMDMDTRMYGSKFALVPWKHEVRDGKVVFDGNEFYPLDLRDCGMDPSATHIRDAKWFQHRKWVHIDELKHLNDKSSNDPMYPGLKELLDKISMDGKLYNSDRRDSRYSNRVLHLKGLSDRVGDDKSFPVCEIVTEYRKNRIITFAPKYRVILRDIENPYNHKKIPIVQNRYYKITGDPLGESEIEPVLSIWRSIQAVICGFLDTMNIHMNPPLKVIESAARIETIIFEPESIMLMDRPDAVTEYQGSSQPLQLFQSTYSALVAAFNQAMGDLSQQVSNSDPFNSKDQKTATEVKYVSKQQNSRDQKNQNSLAECIEDMMSMWISNNKQFLFTDTDKKEYLLQILGGDLFSYFERSGLADMTINPQNMQLIADLIKQNPNLSDEDLATYVDAAQEPAHPVVENPEEKNPAKIRVKPKMYINDMHDRAELSILPEDLEGTYDYIADVESMSAGALQEEKEAIKNTYDIITAPTTLQLLQQEGYTINAKELISDLISSVSRNDTEKYFKQAQPQGQPEQGAGTVQNSPIGGLPAGAFTSTQGSVPGQVPQSPGLPEQGGVQQAGGNPLQQGFGV